MAWKEAFLPADPPKEALGRQKDVSNMRLSSQERKSNMVIASLAARTSEVGFPRECTVDTESVAGFQN
jgi:hypothetical protein